MKILLLLIGLLCTVEGYAQKYYTKTGHIDFEASVKAFEPVEATHKTVTAILNVETGEIAILALIKGFRFRNALMEEHFNENYLESNKYPKAVFKGTIANFSRNDLVDRSKEYTLNGELTLHGKTKDISTTITLGNMNDNWTVDTNFSVAPGDFDIDIPNVVSDKISDQINIKSSFNLAKR